MLDCSWSCNNQHQKVW